MDSPTACVTGATGFVGAAVVAALGERGEPVRAIFRDPSRLSALDGIEGVDEVQADVLDATSMRRAFTGCEVVYHVAGVVGSRPRDRVFEVNGRAPELVVEAASAAGVRRVVLTSTVAAIGPSPRDRPADEDQHHDLAGLDLPYHEAKREGEVRALAAAARTGIELVIVNPSYVLGAPAAPGAAPETSTRIVANYLRGRLPAVVDSWTNIVDVDDVARGHLLAAERGEPGERYILGGTDVRWPVLVRRLGELSGVGHPFIVLPPGARAGADLAAELHLPTPINPLAITLMSVDHRYTSAKAERLLGYEHRGLDEVLRRSVRWFVEELEAGRYSAPDLSAMRLMTVAVGAADRAGVLRAAGLVARPLERLARAL